MIWTISQSNQSPNSRLVDSMGFFKSQLYFGNGITELDKIESNEQGFIFLSQEHIQPERKYLARRVCCQQVVHSPNFLTDKSCSKPDEQVYQESRVGHTIWIPLPPMSTKRSAEDLSVGKTNSCR